MASHKVNGEKVIVGWWGTVRWDPMRDAEPHDATSSSGAK